MRCLLGYCNPPVTKTARRMIIDSTPYFFAIGQMGGDRARDSIHTTRSVLKKVYYYQQRLGSDETKVSALCRVDCIVVF